MNIMFIFKRYLKNKYLKVIQRTLISHPDIFALESPDCAL